MRKRFFSRIFKIRYLRDYLELEKNKNISSHLLVEICSFPGSFEMTETIRGYQNRFSLPKTKSGVKKNDDFLPSYFCVRKIYFDTPLSSPSSKKTPEMNRSRGVDVVKYFYFFITPNSREDIECGRRTFQILLYIVSLKDRLYRIPLTNPGP